MLRHVILPLFTADEISDIYKQNKRVKMTQAEFDEWLKLYDKKSFLIPINFLKLISDVENGYPLIYNIYLDGREKQLELLELWLRFKQENPEETIEIVTTMKWFVRTKEFDDGVYKVLEDIRLDYYEYGNVENDEETAEYGHQFDTKEQAEKWLNPLTEAVQLPVA